MSIEKFFTVMKDGTWHSIRELGNQLGIQNGKLIELSKLLSEKGLIKYKENAQEIRMEPVWKLLLPEEHEPIEPKTRMVTFILPPETSIDIQSMHITNLSNTELEIDLQINSVIREIAIKAKNI